MNEVNRGLFVLKPQRPFLDWVNPTDDDGLVLTLDEVTRDYTAYPTPETGDSRHNFTNEGAEIPATPLTPASTRNLTLAMDWSITRKGSQ